MNVYESNFIDFWWVNGVNGTLRSNENHIIDGLLVQVERVFEEIGQYQKLNSTIMETDEV